MSTSVKIGIGDDLQGPARFVEAWREAEAGHAPDGPEERLIFEDLETLLRHLTPARWALLKALRGLGPSSVRALARALGRDYKNVHSDVAVLEPLGLVARTRKRQIHVPWETVVAEMRLAA